MRRASSAKRSPTSSVLASTWRTALHPQRLQVGLRRRGAGALGLARARQVQARRAGQAHDHACRRTAGSRSGGGRSGRGIRRRRRTSPRSRGRCRSAGRGPSWPGHHRPRHRHGAGCQVSGHWPGVPLLQPKQADQRLGVGDFAAGAQRVELGRAVRHDLEELAGVELRAARRESAREPDLDAFGRIGDGVVQDAGAGPFGRRGSRFPRPARARRRRSGASPGSILPAGNSSITRPIG